MAERFADGLVSPVELEAAYRNIFARLCSYRITNPDDVLSRHFGYSASRCLTPSISVDDARLTLRTTIRRPEILADVFGAGELTSVLDPEWLTSTVVALAEAIYQDRVFDRLPILADALEEEGCGNADVLTHCRSDGPHVRGCWVVDLVTGRK